MDRSQCRYYAQRGEDFLLWNFFAYKDHGFYVDVGAFDGVHLSNSVSFERQGWAGICVEAHPKYFELCRQARPRAACIPSACVGDPELKRVEFFSEELGLLSGVEPGRDADVRDRYAKRGLDFAGFKKVVVPARTLTSILEQHLPAGTRIDFLSVDVEGSELDVLRGLDIARFAPRIIVIEANNDDARAALDKALGAQGYRRGRELGVNAFYARTAEDVAKLATLPAECETEKTQHPLGARYTEAPRRRRRD